MSVFCWTPYIGALAQNDIAIGLDCQRMQYGR